MQFLNAIFLLALPVAATPVIIHLVRRRRPEPTPWGAMQFLTEAVGEGRRFGRVDEWLLMALRTLALLALVLALARPEVADWFGMTPPTHQEVVVVLDDSLSTTLKVEGGQLGERIREQAVDVIEGLSSGHAVRVLLASGRPRWLMDGPVNATPSGKRELAAAIRSTTSGEGSVDFLASVGAASTHETGAGGIPRRVVVLTDGQRHGWRADTPTAWKRLGKATSSHDRPVSVSVLRAPSPRVAEANLAISEVIASRETAGANEEVVFTAKVVNTGAAPSPPTRLEWKVDTDRQSGAPLASIAPGDSLSLSWSTSFARAGVRDIVAELAADDLLSLDNRGGCVLNVIDSIPILIIGDADNERSQSNAFLAAALGLEFNADTDAAAWTSLYQPRFVTIRQAADATLGDYHAVILTSVAGVEESLIERLEEFTMAGGGVWVTLGARVDLGDFNRTWNRDGAGIAPLPLAGVKRPDSVESPDGVIHPPSNKHPATIHLADTQRLDIDRVRLQRYHSFDQQQPGDVETLLSTGRGEPLAVVQRLGKGRGIVQAFPFRTDWTDLVISKAFVVMVQDWLDFLAQGSVTRFNLSRNETFSCKAEPSIGRGVGTVESPNGDRVEVAPVSREGALSYQFSQTTQPGRYTLRPEASSAAPIPFRVARDAEESDLSQLTSEDLISLEQAGGVRFVDTLDSFEVAGADHTRLRPAWWALLFVLVCLMAAESTLASRVGRDRGYSNPIAA